mgnify:CR=1 FL=1
MPQPLSKIRARGTVSIGNSWDNPSDHRPELALLAMKVIAEWSILESFVTGLFVRMLGADPKPGAAMYAALTGSAAQDAVFAALAKVTLPDSERDVFDAIVWLYKSAAKERNKIAHWVWGHAADIKDGVLLTDPDVLLEMRVATHEHEKKAQGWGKFVNAPKFPEDKIYVYYRDDFINTSKNIQNVLEYVTLFAFILNRGHPANANDGLFQELSVVPEIAELLTRRASQRTSQAEQQSQPDQSPPTAKA